MTEKRDVLMIGPPKPVIFGGLKDVFNLHQAGQFDAAFLSFQQLPVEVVPFGCFRFEMSVVGSDLLTDIRRFSGGRFQGGLKLVEFVFEVGAA